MTYNPLHEAVTTIPEFKPRRVAPGKKAVTVAILLSMTLVMSQVFSYGYQQERPPKMTVSRIYGNSFLSLNELAERPSCMKTYLGDIRPRQKEDGTCRLLSPPRGFCSLLQELFSKQPDKCIGSSITFCSEESGNINCEVSPLCRMNEVYIGEANKNSGLINWNLVSNITLTEKVLSITRGVHYKGFLFIGCNVKKKSKQFSLMYHQLFVYVPAFDNHSNLPNVNLIMLDSVSRKHLYRSLPKTISTLESLKAEDNIRVLDFSYVQSITHKTLENLQALFTGYVNTSGSNDHQTKKLGEFLSQLRNKYSVYWLEDFCYKSNEGLSYYLGSNGTWSSFQHQLEQYHVNMGISLSNCEVLQENGRFDPTHNSTSICYNGKYQHDYIFEYLKKLHKYKSLFTFTQLNVGNEYSGVRVQTIDDKMQGYLNRVASLPNTLTIFFSDHGNNNGMLVESSAEGYIETFNPFIFMFIPRQIEMSLGHKHVHNLHENQDKLITLLDVHPVLTKLLDIDMGYNKKFQDEYGPDNGLLEPIFEQRNCNDLPLIMPNLCICKGFEIHVPPSNVHKVLADFAVGSLNNLILRQKHMGGGRGFGSCHILELSGVRNSHELRTTADTIHYKLDVDVLPLGVTKLGARETFFFVIEVSPGTSAIRLLNYERISAYKFYRSCCERHVSLRLCLCDASDSNSRILNMPFLESLTYVPESLTGFLFPKPTNSTVVRQNIKKFVHSIPPDGQTMIDHEYPKRFACIYIIRHQYDVGFNLYAMSSCVNTHKVILHIDNRDYYLSESSYTKYIIHFNELKLLVSGLQMDEDSGTLNYSVEFIPFG